MRGIEIIGDTLFDGYLGWVGARSKPDEPTKLGNLRIVIFRINGRVVRYPIEAV